MTASCLRAINTHAVSWTRRGAGLVAGTALLTLTAVFVARGFIERALGWA
jgi:hypothetical protein